MAHRAITARLVFDFVEGFDPGDLDTLTPGEIKLLADLQIDTADRPLILEERQGAYMQAKQSECDTAIGCATGLIIHHGGFITRIDPEQYNRYNPELVPTAEQLEGLGAVVIRASFNPPLNDIAFGDLAEELLASCRPYLESVDSPGSSD